MKSQHISLYYLSPQFDHTQRLFQSFNNFINFIFFCRALSFQLAFLSQITIVVRVYLTNWKYNTNSLIQCTKMRIFFISLSLSLSLPSLFNLNFYLIIGKIAIFNLIKFTSYKMKKVYKWVGSQFKWDNLMRKFK
jgi:hypothetical protein